jgi:subtilisin family serine protease
MAQIDALGAWGSGYTGSSKIKVAVLDTGIDPSHQDLIGKVDLVNSKSFVPDEPDIYDYFWHGTFVSSIITGNNIGIAAIAPETQVVAIKVFKGEWPLTYNWSRIIEAILYATTVPDVEIINMSFGLYYPKNDPGIGRLVAAVTKAVNYATSKGILVVCASGNEAANLDKDGNYIFIPAQAGTALSIYATNINETLAQYTNYGVSGTWIGAPGGEMIFPSVEYPPESVCDEGPIPGIIGACSSYNNFFPFFSCSGNNAYIVNGWGTSFAAPLVAGVAALLDAKYNGALDAAQLKTKLKQSADDLGKKGTDVLYSHGRVNAAKAVME